MFRRYLSSLHNLLLLAALAAVIVFLALAATQSQAATPTAVLLRVVGPSSAVGVGDQFTVTIQLEGAANLGAFEFEYNFTPAVASATVEAIQLAPMLGSTGRTTGALRLASTPGRPGVPLFGAYSYGTANGPNGSGVLATVAMTALSPGTSPLSLSGLKVTNVAGGELLSTAEAGSVTVVAAPRPIYLPLLLRGN